jgi:hypothetical protein
VAAAIGVRHVLELIMKKLPRNPEIFETLELFKSLSKRESFSLTDEHSGAKFLQKLDAAFQTAKGNPARLHGLRAQSLFEYIVVSLGECSFVKYEDAGDIYASQPDVKPPDFRIILKDRSQLFVEVKNFFQRDPLSEYQVKGGYLAQLKAYADIFGVELKLAVYWTQWNLWTLSSLSCLKGRNGNYYLDLKDALINNEIGLLGDRTIATVPPLVFRVITDPGKPRKVQGNGNVEFTIGGVEILASGVKIEDRGEQNLVLSFMFFGDWPEDTQAVVENDQLISFDFSFEPSERAEDQPFDMVGSLSSMVSRQFHFLTAPEGETERLVPNQEPDDFGIELPPNCKGKQLKLWCFQQVLQRSKD